MALIIYGNVNTFSPNKTMVLDFIKEKYIFVAMPQIFLIICLILMMLGTFFSVGGLFGDTVFYVYIIVVTIISTIVLYYFIYEQGKINKKYQTILLEMPDLE